MKRPQKSAIADVAAEPVQPRLLDQMVTVRLPVDVITALRDVATRRGAMVSDLLRDGANMVIGAPQAGDGEPLAHIELTGRRFSTVWCWRVVFHQDHEAFLVDCSGVALTRRSALATAKRAYAQQTRTRDVERVELGDA